MKILAIAIVVLVAVVLLAVLSKGKGSAVKQKIPPASKIPLTEREQAMYWRLTGALPDLVVLAQVSQSAFLKSNDMAVFRTFSQKVSDFVVCDKAFNVLAVIELDDASHKRKKDKDAKRDAIITAAGLRVIRYNNIPDIAKLHEDFRAERLRLLEQKIKRNAQTAQASIHHVQEAQT